MLHNNHLRNVNNHSPLNTGRYSNIFQQYIQMSTAHIRRSKFSGAFVPWSKNRFSSKEDRFLSFSAYSRDYRSNSEIQH